MSPWLMTKWLGNKYQAEWSKLEKFCASAILSYEQRECAKWVWLVEDYEFIFNQTAQNWEKSNEN